MTQPNQREPGVVGKGTYKHVWCASKHLLYVNKVSVTAWAVGWYTTMDTHTWVPGTQTAPSYRVNGYTGSDTERVNNEIHVTQHLTITNWTYCDHWFASNKQIHTTKLFTQQLQWNRAETWNEYWNDGNTKHWFKRFGISHNEIKHIKCVKGIVIKPRNDALWLCTK